MNNFEYYTPTKVYFGKGYENNVGEYIKNYGAKKVLLHYGKGSAVKSGLIDRVKKSLDANGLKCVDLGGVEPNPRLSLVKHGIELCKQENVDFVLAVGGGSAIDSSKAIALGVCNDTDVWNFFVGKEIPKSILPMGCVLTIAAAGSEMSNSCVITNDYTGEKKGCRTDYNRPLFAVMNPELTYTLPSYQTACGIVDIMMHTIERFFAIGRGNELTDKIAISVLLCVVENGVKSLIKPSDFKSRSELMWAGSLSHNNLTGLGSNGGFVCHPIEHELSAKFDVAHGAGLAVVFPAWARYVVARDIERFAEYAEKVWNVCGDNRLDIAIKGIEKTEEFFKEINMPLTFTDLGIGVQSDDVLWQLANGCTNNGQKTINGFVPLTVDDIYQILKSVNR